MLMPSPIDIPEYDDETDYGHYDMSDLAKPAPVVIRIVFEQPSVVSDPIQRAVAVELGARVLKRPLICVRENLRIVLGERLDVVFRSIDDAGDIDSLIWHTHVARLFPVPCSRTIACRQSKRASVGHRGLYDEKLVVHRLELGGILRVADGGSYELPILEVRPDGVHPCKVNHRHDGENHQHDTKDTHDCAATRFTLAHTFSSPILSISRSGHEGKARMCLATYSVFGRCPMSHPLPKPTNSSFSFTMLW